MNLKKITLLLFIIPVMVFAGEPATTFKLYGYVGNEFFYNSRQNQEMVDGAIMLFPKPVVLSSGKDVNDVAQAEMLSVNTRLGVDFNGVNLLGAKSAAKIEADFAGFGTSFYVLRIRQAYAKLNWEKTELLLGQTWHPMFGSVMPSTPSANGGAPFQPFNRSPQLRVKQNLCKTLTFTAAALYEMQYASMGALGTSNAYMKNALMPDLFAGLENKTTHWILGVGGDVKTLKFDNGKITSCSGLAYAQYSNKLLTIKGKAVYGQNLTDQLMIGGYGVSAAATTSSDAEYTNFNTGTGWINLVYGTKCQFSLLGGYSKNFGTEENLSADANGKYTAYGYGYTASSQTLINDVIRVAPSISYTISNLRVSLEYDYTQAAYGTLKADGGVNNSYNVHNNRILASVSYNF